MPKKSTPTTSQTPLNPITDFNTIPEREELIVNLQYRRKIYPFKIWNLTGIENDNIEKERVARIKEWEKREPKPKTEVKGGQDIPKPDAEYKAKHDEWEAAKNAERGNPKIKSAVNHNRSRSRIKSNDQDQDSGHRQYV